MVKIKKITALLLASALLILPTSASAANVYGVVSNKWEASSSTIQNAVLTDEGHILAEASNDFALLSTVNGETMSKGKNKPMFPTKGMVKMTDGTIFIAGQSGKWKVVDPYGDEISQGKLADPRTPRFVKQLSNENILLVHNSGYYTILNSSQELLRTGKWPNTWHINDTVELANGNLLMVGDQGKYQVMSQQDGKVVNSGDWGSSKHHIYSIDKLSDNRMLAVGAGSKFILFDKTGKKIDNAELSDQENKNYKWDKVVGLENQHALVISSTGVILLVQVDDKNHISVKAKTKISNYSSNGSVFKIADNQVFVTLTSGRFIIYQVDL
ncbi:hypothetical protein COD67_14695 [Bacillus cereus]|nr:hypothetical protein COI89_06020 [Bacillus cereus]PGU65999.1 hypothetical protein COD67_14695 [Bacillus cereus]